MMHQKMGKSEQVSRTSKNGGKCFRKTLLGSSTLAVFLQPTLSGLSSTTTSTPNFDSQGSDFFAANVFSQIKESNKIMVKGSKVHESLSELRLCGWISPYTLLLVGPSEDMKIVKHAWVKRHLKNPKEYVIKDIGIVRDCIVEMIQQSPFMSLTTALFEAVADLNHQNIFPTKDTLFDYLRKQYPEIKTPDTKVIHECLGRLIKNRRLYHNGRGYFILLNENVLNEVIAVKSSLNQQQFSDTTSLEPSIVGFMVNDSRTSSSGHTDGHTDMDLKARQVSKNQKKFDNSSPGETLTEVSTIADIANLSELNSPKVPRTTLGSKLFRKNNSKSEKTNKAELTGKTTNKNNNKLFTCSGKGSITDSVISNKNSPSCVPLSSSTYNSNLLTISKIDNISSNDTQSNLSERKAPPTPLSPKERPKPRRSKSFSGKTRKERLANKEVSFALVGLPNVRSDESSFEDDQTLGQFKRSHSFGAGYTKHKHQRPQLAVLRTLPTSKDLHNGGSSLGDTFDHTNFHESTYGDIETSFVDDSVPSFDPDHELAYDPEEHLAHRPDMLPVVNSSNFDMLNNYNDLGSALSLPRINDKALNFNMMDLLSPTKKECLAEELKQVYETNPANESRSDIESINAKLLSPRSRRRLGTPYESQYISEVLTQSKHICQVLEDTKKDNNSNYMDRNNVDEIPNKDGNISSVGVTETSSKGVKLRSKVKPTEEKKRNQKERNSQLFEEKRSSLKVMGMV